MPKILSGGTFLEGRLDDLPGRRRDDEEGEAVPLDAPVQELDEGGDVVLQSHAASGFGQVLGSNASELGIVADEVRQLAALLDEVAAGEAGHLLLKARGADQLG